MSADNNWELRCAAAEENCNAALSALARVASAAGCHAQTMDAKSIAEVGEIIAAHVGPDRVYAFNPDWCIAPAATLLELLREHKTTPQEAARRYAREPGAVHNEPAALARLKYVLDRKPYGPFALGTEDVPAFLAALTGAPASFWLALESNYREGLIVGRQDTT